MTRRRTAARLDREIDQALGEPEAASRLFVGTFSTGISYADRSREKNGDYLRLAFLPFRTLELEWQRSVRVPPEMRRQIVADAKRMAARRGELYSIDSSDHAVRLGG